MITLIFKTIVDDTFQGLFPDRDVASGPLSVICLSQKTSFDMSTWSEEVENERDLLTEQFISVAKEICGR
jgi:hypothetical protein